LLWNQLLTILVREGLCKRLHSSGKISATFSFPGNRFPKIREENALMALEVRFDSAIVEGVVHEVNAGRLGGESDGGWAG
jgi:hypothetical protein